MLPHLLLLLTQIVQLYCSFLYITNNIIAQVILQLVIERLSLDGQAILLR